VFIKDKTKAASRMSAGINFVKLLWEANKKNSVLEISSHPERCVEENAEVE